MDIVQIIFSLNTWKDLQLDFNIVSIKASPQNVSTLMETKNPMQKSETETQL